jgi:hypothetical protein
MVIISVRITTGQRVGLAEVNRAEGIKCTCKHRKLYNSSSKTLITGKAATNLSGLTGKLIAVLLLAEINLVRHFMNLSFLEIRLLLYLLFFILFIAAVIYLWQRRNNKKN